MFSTSSMVSSGGASVATTSIVNYFSSGGTQAPTSFPAQSGIKSTLSGALTANTLKTMLNITGSAGSMYALGVTVADATARTVRLKVTIDGNGSASFDATSSSITTSSNGISAAVLTGPPIKWKSSCLVEIASSLPETDKLTLGYMYNVES